MRKSISQQSSSLLAIFAADERLFDLNTANIYNCPPAKVPPDSAQRQDLLRGIEPVFESVPRSGRLLLLSRLVGGTEALAMIRDRFYLRGW